jgi:hypothetical protein
MLPPPIWFCHAVSFKRRTGVNSVDGTPAYGALGTIRARVEKKTKLMRGKDGKDVQVGHVMATVTAVLYDDEFWFPAIGAEPADDTSSPDNARTPLAIQTATDRAGRQVMFEVGFA